MTTVTERVFEGPFVRDFERDAPHQGVSLWWLGQAGFALRAGGVRLLIDPYLSDSLAAKYRGCEFPHMRQMPAPVAPEDVRRLDGYLCSHGHSDHMDPGTIPGVAAGNPGCLFIVPLAERATAMARGVPPDRLASLNDGDRLALDGGVELEAVASAHEQLQTDAAGAHRFLGFIVRMGGVVVYHSGDCVPYEGLAARLTAGGVSVALLPVNGRDAFRTRRGILGNFHLAEAVALCREAGIGVLIVHHFGMFDFNTVPEEELRRESSVVGAGVRVIVPRCGVRIEL
jgi:L-ascorbate metabolism protein UlaG (beta-lactamase superfamily)